MKPRNVILSLLLVLAFLVLAFIKVRFWEPERKLTFNRNPLRIKYSEFALCRMDCYFLNANDVTEVLKNGEINLEKSDLKKRPCPVFKLHGRVKKDRSVWITVEQCGKIAKIIDCTDEGIVVCNCTDNESRPISFYKK